MFQCFSLEYNNIIEKKNLDIRLIKIKGHEHPENIIVDELAKEGARGDNNFEILDLFDQNQNVIIEEKTRLIIFDYRNYITKTQLENFMELVRDKSDSPLPKGWYSINLKYLKKDLDPLTKYAIWRNMSDNHIRQHQKVECRTCKRVVDLEHYIYDCPSTQHFRDYLYKKFSDMNHVGCFLDRRHTCWENPRKRLLLQHTGFLQDQYLLEILEKSTSRIIQNWPHTQSLLSLLVGKCHTVYYQDFLETQKAIRSANRARKSKSNRTRRKSK